MTRSVRALVLGALLAGVACGAPPPERPPANAPAADPYAGLEAHARARDAEGARLCARALASTDGAARARGMAALLDYGTSPPKGAHDALVAALTRAQGDERAAAVWVLLAGGDDAVLGDALAEYRKGRLQRVTLPGRAHVYAPVVLARAVAGMPWPKPTDATRERVLVEALPVADAETRGMLLQALEDAEGGPGLVAAIGGLTRAPRAIQLVFERLRAAPDPRAADALAAYLASGPPPHLRTEAALRLAELGDLRAAPHLAWRLGQDPATLYAGDPDFPELARDDRERVVCARMLTDLAVLHPEALASLRASAEDAALAWANGRPQPHANALRFLAAVGGPKALPALRRWADPTSPLPAPGAEPFPAEFLVAQSALRDLGETRDRGAWALLQKQLFRRPKGVDVSMGALMQGGHAVLGMTLRALAFGAADGFAEWGDSRAFPLLGKYVQDARNNEDSRLEACVAIAWVATDAQRRTVVARAMAVHGASPEAGVLRGCWLEALARRPVSAVNAGLVGMLSARVPPEAHHAAARALGLGGLDPSIEGKVRDLLKDRARRHDAALTLLLGGSDDDVAEALGAYETGGGVQGLRQLYFRSIPPVTDAALASGDLARWAARADAARRVRVRGAAQDWVWGVLGQALRDTQLDSGPHTLTRTVLRARLLAAARASDAAKRDDALRLLALLGERGVLAALAAEDDPLGAAARKWEEDAR